MIFEPSLPVEKENKNKISKINIFNVKINILMFNILKGKVFLFYFQHIL